MDEKVGYWFGYWMAKVGMPLIEPGIAFELLQVADGEFQTIVISVLGLIYCRLRELSAQVRVTGYSLALSDHFHKQPNCGLYDDSTGPQYGR
jgi:hypothetical protein